ncbi:MAG: hypothetical protein JJU27_07235 [Gammaproteobacteria bacterium]|nr:hypothetical protein [Gammaproteobacteria bacterium]
MATQRPDMGAAMSRPLSPTTLKALTTLHDTLSPYTSSPVGIPASALRSMVAAQLGTRLTNRAWAETLAALEAQGSWRPRGPRGDVWVAVAADVSAKAAPTALNETHRTCKDCEQTLPIHRFTPHAGMRSGRRNSCSTCDSKRRYGSDPAQLRAEAPAMPWETMAGS